MLKAILLSCAFGALAIGAAAQTIDTAKKSTRTIQADSIEKLRGKPGVFFAMEGPPQFPGGVPGFVKYIATEMRYPKAARDAKVQGRVVVAFIIDTDGEVREAKIVNSISKELDEEALRVVKASPRWKPGVQNNKPVRVQYQVPINFSL